MTESITRILVPVDFSAHSEKAVRFATTLANKFGARVSLLHVVEDPFVTGAWQSEAFVANIPELLNDLIKAARAHLDQLKKNLAAHGFVVEAVVITGTARSRDRRTRLHGWLRCDRHGDTRTHRLAHALMGSVAERVVQRVPCAVLTVREGARPAAKTVTTTAIAAV